MLENDESVHLKSFLGIRPGKYLAFLYACIILVIIFLALFLPGITHSGSVMRFSSIPTGAAVRVDDIYFDTTPCDIFVPSGNHTFTLVMPGFVNFQTDRLVKGRLFASAIFPRRSALEAELAEVEPFNGFIRGAQAAAAWSFTGEPNTIYQVPPELSQGAYRSFAALRVSGALDETWRTEILRMAAEEYLKPAARFTSSIQGLRDVARSKFLIDNFGKAASPLGIADTMRDIFAFISENPAYAVQIAGLLGEDAKPLLESAWYKENIIDQMFNPIQARRETASFGGTVSVASFPFVEVSSGVYNPEFNTEIDINRFYLAVNEINPALWDNFIAENRKWSPENKEELIAEGLVTAGYLEKIDDPSFPSTSISGVSWHAAAAFCKWLTTKLPASLAQNWEARLPTEAEWEWAALAVDSGRGPVRKMLPAAAETPDAGLWEWCADPFAPIQYLQAAARLIELVSSPQRPVRGGSWINPAGTVILQTRGGLESASCSAFVGFRPVIALKNANK